MLFSHRHCAIFLFLFDFPPWFDPTRIPIQQYPLGVRHCWPRIRPCTTRTLHRSIRLPTQHHTTKPNSIIHCTTLKRRRHRRCRRRPFMPPQRCRRCVRQAPRRPPSAKPITHIMFHPINSTQRRRQRPQQHRPHRTTTASHRHSSRTLRHRRRRPVPTTSRRRICRIRRHRRQPATLHSQRPPHNNRWTPMIRKTFRWLPMRPPPPHRPLQLPPPLRPPQRLVTVTAITITTTTTTSIRQRHCLRRRPPHQLRRPPLWPLRLRRPHRRRTRRASRAAW